VPLRLHNENFGPVDSLRTSQDFVCAPGRWAGHHNSQQLFIIFYCLAEVQGLRKCWGLRSYVAPFYLFYS
jgi:hypothetical protein